MSRLRVLHLYRPRLPTGRAQSIQVLGTCHGLASLGCEVTLLADAPADNTPVDQLPTPAQVLEFYGLPPVVGLDLRLSPTSLPGPQGFWFRKHFLSWVIESALFHQGRSVILARAKRYFDEYTILPFGPPVVLEAHELDSGIAESEGQPSGPVRKLEDRLLREARGLVTNCQGTLQQIEAAHPQAVPANRRVVYNATSPWRVRDRVPSAEPVVGYAGSLRSFKGLSAVIEAAKGLPQGARLELLGGSEQERDALGALPKGVRLVDALPYASVPERIAHWHAAILPLDDNYFGRHLANPLKLWDYRAIGLPIVAADMPTLREVLAPEEAFWYNPKDPESLRVAIAQAMAVGRARKLRRMLRSWTNRAEELMPVLEAALSP